MVTPAAQAADAARPADAADALALAICHIWRGAAADKARAARGSCGVAR